MPTGPGPGPGHGGPLDGLRVLVSGGGGAIGTAVCAELLRQGAQVVVADVRPPDGDWPGAGAPPRYETCDVADEAAVGRLLSKLAAEGALPDVVCCHAGVNHEHPVTDYPMAEFDEIFRVNVRGAFVLAQSAAQVWLERQVPGHLIFTTSWVAGVPWPGIAPYAASKAAVVSLMRSFAAELAGVGVRANAIAPGIVSAGVARQQWDASPEYRKLARQAIALGTLQEPASVARALAMMCTPDFAYMTGSVLTIDGGCSLSMLG